MSCRAERFVMRWVNMGRLLQRYVDLQLVCQCRGRVTPAPSPSHSPEGYLILQPQEDKDVYRTKTPHTADIAVAVSDAEGRPICGAGLEFTFSEDGAGARVVRIDMACVKTD